MVCIVGPRACFWVVLNAKDGFLTVGDGRDGSIVEIEMGDIDLIRRKGIRIESEPVILAGDLHLTRGPAGMVQTAMAIGELEGGTPQGQTKDLVPQADSKHWKIFFL